MRTRKGHIQEVRRNRGTYYRAIICVNRAHLSRCSYDRAEVEAWLADMLSGNAAYEVDTNRAAFRATMAAKHVTMGERPVPRSNPFAGAKAGVTETPSLWMVAAETNPLTARYHIRQRMDWPRPRRVLTYDPLSETPVAWVADDNGGEGYGSEEEARIAALSIEHDPSVMLTVRPLSRRWRDGGNDNNESLRTWQGE